jgi:hypothetical protein
MLSKDEIDRVGLLCAQLGPSRSVAFSLAAGHRTLPVYQVYAEQARGVHGYGATHDAMIGIWRVLRGRPGATAAAAASQAEVAVARATADCERIQESNDFGVAESLAVESISAALFALNSFLASSSDDCYSAAMSALEVDSVWAEADADRPDSSGVVDWAILRRHYEQQTRDLEALLDAADSALTEVLREIQFRAESEGMYYLTRMRDSSDT